MNKNTGMNAKDEKAGKTVKLSPKKAKEVTKMLKDEESDAPPTKTIELIRGKKKSK